MDAEKLASLERLLERQEIMDCLTRFCRGIDRFDRELFLSAFHPDATIAAGSYVGPPEPNWTWAQAMHESWQVMTHHNMLNHSVEIDGDTAHAETYYMFVARNRDETVWIAGGRYIDRLERRNGEWRIALRTNAIEWATAPPAIPLPFADVPDIAVNGVASRSKDDPSYQRPLTNKRVQNLQDGSGG